MKKAILIFLSIAMCFSICACGEKKSTSSAPKKLNVKQELVNICCSYSNCHQLKYFEIGSQSQYEEDGVYKVSAKGTYFPIDSYGDTGTKMTFEIEFTAEWNEEKSDYDINVTKKIIKPKHEILK